LRRRRNTRILSGMPLGESILNGDIQLPWLFYDTTASERTSVSSSPQEEIEESDPEAIHCRACGWRITSRSQVSRRDGQFEHVFSNPAGIVFHIGCFNEAPGCTVSGTPTDFFSWFSGYSWSYAQCACCGLHAGWRFQSIADAFFGLNLDALTGLETS
jgi:hypothetical protein